MRGLLVDAHVGIAERMDGEAVFARPGDLPDSAATAEKSLSARKA